MIIYMSLKGKLCMNDEVSKNNNLYQIIKNDMSKMSEEEANVYIKILLEDYENRKKENRLYKDKDIKDISVIPKIIIKSYYECVDELNFNALMKKFRRKYILNENKVEAVHTREEREGLGIVYEFIQNFNDIKNINIYTLLRIHQFLYSKVPYPEFGGKFRTRSAYLPGSGTDTTNYDLIPDEMSALYLPVQELIQEGVGLSKVREPEKIIQYIDKCVELKCKLIKIHPFDDGNGRSIRAFINLLFKIANIPPIYIRSAEKNEYGKAMQIAVNENDYSDIKTFYYFKVCDSIIELDLNYNEEKERELEEKEDAKKL